MVNEKGVRGGAPPPSQSHGGTLYYVIQVPRDEYSKDRGGDIVSTESGWDNPFRPGGDLSREADEIVNMIKGGKPITPTSDVNQTIANGSAQKDTGNHAVENGTAVLEGATKVEVSQAQTAPAQNGTKSPLTNNNKTTTKTTAPGGGGGGGGSGKANGDAKTSQTQVSNQVIPGPTSASHVVIEDKKKKKCTCCVIQ